MKKHVFEGLKVLDLGWVGVGPISGAFLGAHGATVIRIESTTRPDILRSMSPFKDNKPGLNSSAFFAKINFNKFGAALNLTKPKGIEIAKRLIKWADVVIEGFTPGTVEKWGLGYEDLIKIKPDVIMVRTSQQGETGPHRLMPGFGAQLAALAGFTHLTGWPDSNPAGPFGAYTDFTGGSLLFFGVVSALIHKHRTGEGQELDLSQFEAGVQFLAPVILDYITNNHIVECMGNRSDHAVPHGAFPCKGEDGWCAVSVNNDDEWTAFCKVLQHPEWTKNDRYSTILKRFENENELNRLIEEWTKQYSAQEVMEMMQAAGIEAGVVQTTQDIQNDPQLKHGHFLRELNHTEIGAYHYDSPPFALSKTPAELTMAAACLGEHNEYVYKELLGMSEEEYVRLLIEGVLE